MLIRNATIDDLDAVSSVEAQCFPAGEAATAEEFLQRLEYYANHFWLMFDEERLCRELRRADRRRPSGPGLHLDRQHRDDSDPGDSEHEPVNRGS